MTLQQLESLVHVHRNLQEHQELVDAITEFLREKDTKHQTSKKQLKLRENARLSTKQPSGIAQSKQYAAAGRSM